MGHPPHPNVECAASHRSRNSGGEGGAPGHKPARPSTGSAVNNSSTIDTLQVAIPRRKELCGALATSKISKAVQVKRVSIPLLNFGSGVRKMHQNFRGSVSSVSYQVVCRSSARKVFRESNIDSAAVILGNHNLLEYQYSFFRLQLDEYAPIPCQAYGSIPASPNPQTKPAFFSCT